MVLGQGLRLIEGFLEEVTVKNYQELTRQRWPLSCLERGWYSSLLRIGMRTFSAEGTSQTQACGCKGQAILAER